MTGEPRRATLQVPIENGVARKMGGVGGHLLRVGPE